MPEVCARNRGTRVYLSPEVIRALKSEAARSDRSMSDLIREILAAHLRKSDRPKRGR